MEKIKLLKILNEQKELEEKMKIKMAKYYDKEDGIYKYYGIKPNDNDGLVAIYELFFQFEHEEVTGGQDDVDYIIIDDYHFIDVATFYQTDDGTICFYFYDYEGEILEYLNNNDNYEDDEIIENKEKLKELLESMKIDEDVIVKIAPIDKTCIISDCVEGAGCYIIRMIDNINSDVELKYETLDENIDEFWHDILGL